MEFGEKTPNGANAAVATARARAKLATAVAENPGNRKRGRRGFEGAGEFMAEQRTRIAEHRVDLLGFRPKPLHASRSAV